MEQLKLGFIGSGFIAKFHAIALQQVRNVEISALYRRSTSDELAGFIRENGLGDCQVYDTVKEVCENSDAVAILAPNYVRVEHMEAIVDAVKEGAELKGIICEKPLGRTVAEGKRLLELAKEVGLPTAYFENQLHMKAIQHAKNQLAPQQEAMGPLVLARSSEEHTGPHSGWFWDPTKQGGGVLSDMGCHSIAVSWYVLNPLGTPVDYLKPVSISADTSLVKWGQEKFRKQLLEEKGVDYSKVPAEDYCTGVITFENPDTGQRVKATFTNSWMYDKQGLRLLMEGLGPGYAFEVNSLKSPLEVFVGDAAATAVADAETAVEKATSTRGLIAVHPNEADLYGYNSVFEDARDAFLAGKDAMLNFDYGLQVTKLVQAAYMAAEKGRTIDLTDDAVQKELDGYTSLIAQGRGAEVLFR